MDPLNPLHIDVLSLKGGAGKTTTSFLLARSLATDLEPVLLIDADLTGSCLGDLLYPNDQPGWPQRAGLAHLLCVHPETLNDRLKTRPPVYAAPAPIGGEVRLFSEQDVSGELLCPSHLYALAADGYDRVDSHLLTALAAHETAASWCSHVIDALTTHVRVTVAKSTTADGAPRKLKAVIVDHSPGIGAFQQRVLDETGHTMSVKLLVRTDDLVDRVMVDEFLAIIQGDASEKKSHSARKSPIIEVVRSKNKPNLTKAKFTLHLSEEQAIADAFRGSSLAKLEPKQWPIAVKSQIEALGKMCFEKSVLENSVVAS